MTITVVVVDDHPLVRGGLRALLAGQSDLEVVGEAADGLEAEQEAGRLRPDVVLMDLSMPGPDGIESTRRLLEVHPDARVVILTSFHDLDRVSAALRAGAVGYLLKDAEPETIVAGVRAAARGEAPFDPRAAVALLPAPAPAVESQLSGREREVLLLIAAGRSNRQIGRTLGIAERTVKVHVGNVFRRIGVSDRTSAALWARDNLPMEKG
jgi:DNA-binding NarL/FixJ family response regulator